MKTKIMTLAAAFVVVCTMVVISTTPVHAETGWECGHTDIIGEYLDTKADCDTPTIYRGYCQTCKDFVNRPEGEALGHLFTNKIKSGPDYPENKKSDATCIAPAQYYYTCERCPAVGTESFDYGTVSTKHDYVKVNCVRGECTLCGKGAIVRNGKHDFTEATCTAPKTCKKCGETEGDVVHFWKEATCAAPKTCEKCGATEGKTKSHSYYEATCTAPKTCRDCGATEGNPAPHNWSEPTCVTSKVCSKCGKVGSGPLPHKEVVVPKVEATCNTFGFTAGKKCSICGTWTVKQKLIALRPHKLMYVSVVPATVGTEGNRTKICSKCYGPYDTTKIPKISKITMKETMAYTGKALKPKVTVVDAKGKTLKQGKDYTVKYGNNKAIGNAYADVIFKGDYYGTTPMKFQVVPKSPTIKKPVAAKKALTAKWYKGKKAQVTGYEVMISTSKYFVGGKTTTVKGYSKSSVKIKKLTSKKTYYVKVRCYKTVKIVGRDVKIYSGWSKVKSVKVK